jgi:hypothetical protein
LLTSSTLVWPSHAIEHLAPADVIYQDSPHNFVARDGHFPLGHVLKHINPSLEIWTSLARVSHASDINRTMAVPGMYLKDEPMKKSAVSKIQNYHDFFSFLH